MARIIRRLGRRGHRLGLRRRRERGAQALEYMALGTAVTGMIGSAGAFLHGHGGDIGAALLNQLKTGLGQ